MDKHGLKMKTVYLRWNLVLRLIRICCIQWWCSNFGQISFGQILFLGKWCSKRKNCLIKNKLGVYINLKYAELDGTWSMSICPALERKYTLPGSLDQKFITVYSFSDVRKMKCVKKLIQSDNQLKNVRMFLFYIINYKTNLKQLLRLIANIYKYKGDNIILPNSTLCMPPKRNEYLKK